MNYITKLSMALFVATTPVVHADKASVSSVDVVIEVPNPGWSIKIESLHTKTGKLLVVCKASKAEGMHMSMIAKAKASVGVSKDLTKLPREIYVLDQGWKWSKGYTPVTEAELKKVLEGSKPVKFNNKASTKKPGADDFVGLTIKEAEALAKKHKIKYRVVMIDGKPLPATMDFLPERLNFTLVKGKVTNVSKG